MHEFTPESVDKYLTPEALNGLNVLPPNNHGEYPTKKEFMIVSNEEKKLAQDIFTSISQIINNNELPNIKSD